LGHTHTYIFPEPGQVTPLEPQPNFDYMFAGTYTSKWSTLAPQECKLTKKRG